MESLDEILRSFGKKGSERLTTSTSGAPDQADVTDDPNAPDCDVCDGRRWIAVEANLGTPEFGSVKPCECQERVWGANVGASLRRYSQLGSLERLTFGNLDERGRIEHVESASFRAASDAARAFVTDPQGWFVLLGPSGTGKTHLAAAMANQLVTNEKAALYISVPELLDHLRAAFDGENEITPDSIISQIVMAPVLVLDDIGVGTTSNWANEKIDRILSYRFNSRAPTILVTSADAATLDERIRTRMFDMILSQVHRLESARHAPGLEESGLPKALFDSMTFDQFTPRGRFANAPDQDSLKYARDACKAFADDPQGWLLLMGGTGTGKTHLSVAIARERIGLGESVLFRFVPDLLDHLRRAFAPNSGLSYDVLFEQVKTADILILDDLGGESSSPWAEEKLYQLIVYRHNNRLPTVITTRLLLDADSSSQSTGRGRRQTTFTDAIASRLKDQRVVTILPISAPDYRE
ncbi:MAG: ATP-binding protein [Chloroflexi bacterium]|nr:ATP-binding protein [Chloroflexota bacterium]